MSKIIEVRRKILKSIEKLAQECSDVMHYLSVKMIYVHLKDELGDDCPQITELEGNLQKAKEYRIKLEGGLETLNLLEEKPEEADAPAPEAPAE